MQDQPPPWWTNNPELEEIKRRALAELLGDGDDVARARELYADAVLAARTAGLSWGEIGRVLGVSRQQLHRRFSRRASA
jgi:DNA-directed RNA polymerase specialized sigma24 family protein